MNATTTLISRRNALRLAAATAVPVVAAVAIPGLTGSAFAVIPSAEPSGSTTIGSEIAGVYTKPSASNTGVKAGTVLTKHTGDITVTVDGTILENLDVYGFIKIRAKNVIVRNSRVRGSGPGTSNTGLVDCNHRNVRNALIEDCLLVPDKPSVWLDGVIGKEYTARRCHVYNTVDGFGVYNVSDKAAPTNVTIESCYVHDLAWFSKDPNHSNGPTHNDGIQIQGGGNIRIRGNNIQAFLSKTAGTKDFADNRLVQGILVQPNLAPITNSDISYNWFDGSKVCVYFTLPKAGTKQVFGTMEGNRFGHNQYVYSGGSTYHIRIKKGVTFTNNLSSNVFDDTNLPFAESKTGGVRYDA